jgi:hypothetical protein
VKPDNGEKEKVIYILASKTVSESMEETELDSVPSFRGHCSNLSQISPFQVRFALY